MAVHAPALFYELPVRRFPSAAERLKAPPREGRTLEDVISGAWEELSAHRAAACPVCDGVLEPRYGPGPSAVGGRCSGCGSELG